MSEESPDNAPDRLNRLREFYRPLGCRGKLPIEPVTEFNFHAGAEDLLAEFRALCSETSASSAIVPIENITMVGGAIYSDDSDFLNPHDQEYLRDVLETCKNLNIPVSPKFKLTVLNLAYDESGDFLKNPVKSDLIVACYIYNDRMKKDDEFFSQSDQHFDKEAWYNAAQKSGARVIMTYGGGTEINAADFSPPSGLTSAFRKCRETDRRVGPARVQTLVRSDIAEKLEQSNSAVFAPAA